MKEALQCTGIQCSCIPNTTFSIVIADMKLNMSFKLVKFVQWQFTDEKVLDGKINGRKSKVQVLFQGWCCVSRNKKG